MKRRFLLLFAFQTLFAVGFGLLADLDRHCDIEAMEWEEASESCSAEDRDSESGPSSTRFLHGGGDGDDAVCDIFPAASAALITTRIPVDDYISFSLAVAACQQNLLLSFFPPKRFVLFGTFRGYFPCLA